MIIRDEAVNGLFVGILAQKVLDRIPEGERKELVDEVYSTMLELFE